MCIAEYDYGGGGPSFPGSEALAGGTPNMGNGQLGAMLGSMAGSGALGALTGQGGMGVRYLEASGYKHRPIK